MIHFLYFAYNIISRQGRPFMESRHSFRHTDTRSFGDPIANVVRSDFLVVWR